MASGKEVDDIERLVDERWGHKWGNRLMPDGQVDYELVRCGYREGLIEAYPIIRDLIRYEQITDRIEQVRAWRRLTNDARRFLGEVDDEPKV